MKTFTVTLMGAIYMSYVCNFDFLHILWLCVNFGNSFLIRNFRERLYIGTFEKKY